MSKGKRVKANPPSRVTSGMLPKERAWQLDTDYWEKLSPDERKWKAQFDDEYYRCDFRYEQPLHTHAAAKRERYSAQNASHRDAYSRAQVTSRLVGEADVPVVSVPPSASYLETAEYKAAVREVVKLIDIPARERTKHQRARIVILQRYIKSVVEAGEQDE